MGKMHSKLEMLMREIGSALGLGFQFKYLNNSSINTNTPTSSFRGHGHTNGRWYLEIWDQRPGHYAKRTDKHPDAEVPGLHPFGRTISGVNKGPSQKWYNNQDTDYFEYIYDKEDCARKRTKDEFIEYLLFDSDVFFKKLPMLKTKSLEGMLLTLEIEGKDTAKVRKMLENATSSNAAAS